MFPDKSTEASPKLTMRATEASSQMLKQKTFNLLIAAPFLRKTSNGSKLDKEPNLQMTYWEASSHL